jgi:hypothetical protein
MDGFRTLRLLAPRFEWLIQPCMAGAKRAVRFGNEIHLSPAMASLIANAANLDDLVTTIHRIIRLPNPTN